jgi:hypothetical protein
MQDAAAAWKRLPKKDRQELKDAWDARSSERFERVGLALSEDAWNYSGAERDSLLMRLDLLARVVHGLRENEKRKAEADAEAEAEAEAEADAEADAEGGGKRSRSRSRSRARSMARERSKKVARPRRPLNAPPDEVESLEEAEAAAEAEKAFREAFHLETGQVFRQDAKLESINFVDTDALDRIMAKSPADDLISVSAWVKNRPLVLCPPGGPCKCVMTCLTSKMNEAWSEQGEAGERRKSRYERRLNRFRETLLDMMTGSDKAAEAAALKMVRQLKACNAQKGAGPE